jgi:thiazole synthase ThiGH ThiG subunit
MIVSYRGHEFESRFILGSGKFSLDMTKSVIENGGVEMATLALRRANVGGEENISRLYARRHNFASQHLRSQKCK